MVESALTLPLSLFLILGTLQLFMMLQARIMAEYAAFRAVRAGSLNHGNCIHMRHAAIASLLPTFAKVTSAKDFADAFGKYKDNEFGSLTVHDQPLGNTPILWILRDSPEVTDIPGPEDHRFDSGDKPMRLHANIVFWYPLRIPFVDWVMSRMFLAHLQLLPYTGANPLILTDQKDWTGTPHPNAFGNPAVVERYQELVQAGHYVFPIQASYSMRMMTPARRSNFQPQHCL
jgi:hypothetical protein